MPLPKIVITRMPPRTQAYYDWLITGLEILREQGKIEIEYPGHIWNKLLRRPKAMNLVRRISPDFEEFLSPIDDVCLTGRLLEGDKVMNFAVDIADSPFSYSLALLETVDLYFKWQCPVKFEREGYALNSKVRVPYHPDVFTFQEKIRPGMLGRPLSHSISLKKNLAVLRQWESAVQAKKDIRIFASFGSNDSPKPRTAMTPLPAPYNYQSEPSLLARWGKQVHHPNIKRARLVEILRDMNKPDIDARLWRTNNPKLKGPVLTEAQYMDSLGRAMVNINISGFRRSLPYRFMDTFLTGGMLATDTLAIRWYKDFDKNSEIYEFGDLGYEPDENVNWEQVKQMMLCLYEKCTSPNFQENSKAVVDSYKKKWAPQVFAAHFVEQCSQKIQNQN